MSKAFDCSRDKFSLRYDSPVIHLSYNPAGFPIPPDFWHLSEVVDSLPPQAIPEKRWPLFYHLKAFRWSKTWQRSRNPMWIITTYGILSIMWMILGGDVAGYLPPF